MNAPVYAFCEPVSATPTSRVHIREVPDGEKPKYGGGITGSPLCGYDLLGGWDIPGPVARGTIRISLGAEVAPQCPDCAKRWAEINGKAL